MRYHMCSKQKNERHSGMISMKKYGSFLTSHVCSFKQPLAAVIDHNAEPIAFFVRNHSKVKAFVIFKDLKLPQFQHVL